MYSLVTTLDTLVDVLGVDFVVMATPNDGDLRVGSVGFASPVQDMIRYFFVSMYSPFPNFFFLMVYVPFFHISIPLRTESILKGKTGETNYTSEGPSQAKSLYATEAPAKTHAVKHANLLHP